MLEEEIETLDKIIEAKRRRAEDDMELGILIILSCIPFIIIAFGCLSSDVC